MDFKLLLVLSAMGMTCAASIQDPYIHDSAEDQIAMESGPTQTIVVAPPHLQPPSADAPAVEPELADPFEQGEIVEADGDNEVVAAPETEVKKASTPFTVLVNDAPLAPVRRPAPLRPAFSSLAVRRPALSPLMQMALLSRLQPQLQYGAGGALGGFSSSPIIMLQPIIIPVPVSADGEMQPNALHAAEDAVSSLMFRQQQRPLSLMDLLQRGYYAF